MLPITAPGARRRGLTAALGTLGVLTTLCAYLLGAASPAAAHAVLTGSSPASGAVVSSAPEQVTLTFSESVRLTEDSVRVLGPDGDRADTGAAPRDLGSGSTHRYGTRLRPGLPDGTYTVAWQAVSADSHPVSGAFTFSIGAPSETSVALPRQEAGGGLVGLLYDVARYAAYAGFLLLVGGAAFVLACWPRGARVRAVQRVVTAGWVGLTAATLALLLLRASYVGSGKLADVFDLGALGDVVGTKTGTALVSRLLLLAAAALFAAVLFGTYRAEEGLENRRDVVTGLALGGTVVAVGLATTWAASQHASTGLQPGVAMPVDVLHLLAVAAWLGGLATLTAALWPGTGAVPHSAVRRFSRVALGSVIVLAATGLYQSWRQVGSRSALTGTDYGHLLLLKVALVAALIALGWYSRRWTAKLSRSDTAGAGSGAGSRTSVPATVDASAERCTDQAQSAARPTEGNVDGVAAQSRPFTVSQALPRPGPRSPDGLPLQSVRRSRTENGMRVPPTPHGGTSHAEGVGGVEGGRGRGQDPPRAAGGAEVGAPAGGETVRAAQLARQRQAVEAARRRRQRNADPQRARLRRSVLTESAVAVVILAVTTLLTGTEPARTADAEAADSASAPATEAPSPSSSSSRERLTIPFDTGGPQGKGTAHITLDPGRMGRNTFRVRLTAPGGTPLRVPEVKASFTLPAKDIGPLRVTPRDTGSGRWTKDGFQLPVPGAWEMALTVRTSDIDQVTETRTLRIS